MAGLHNLSLRRKLQAAQNTPQNGSKLIAAVVTGSDVTFEFDTPLPVGSGLVVGAFWVGTGVYTIVTFPMFLIDETHWQGNDAQIPTAEIFWLIDGADWRTNSNGPMLNEVVYPS